MDYIAYLTQLVDLTKLQKEQLNNYYLLLKEKSQVMNLTTITDEQEVYIKHFYDSILALKNHQITTSKLLDVGSGAGFPGVVLKIIYPNLDVVLLEPTKKRCDFLEEVVNKLGLKKIEIINERAENYIIKNRDCFDFVVARAVASLNILTELCLGFVKINGYFIAMKATNYQEELENATNAILKMGGKLEQINVFELPDNYGSRVLLNIKKQKSTPLEYPRTYAKIKKKPL